VAQEAFTIDWEARRVTCPQGHTSAVWSAQRHNVRGVPIVQVFLPPRTAMRVLCARHAPAPPVCAGAAVCSFWTVPSKKPTTPGGADRTARSSRPATALRAGVEGTIAQAVRRSGIGTTCYIGLSKTHLGHVFSATALNLVRLDARWTGKPLGATRTSHFTKLALALAA
jgi:Transposase DDE domain